MDKLFLAALLMVLSISCKDTVPERYLTTLPEIDVVTAMITDYEKGNWEGFVSHYSNDAKLQHNQFKLTMQELRDVHMTDTKMWDTYGFNKEEDNIFYEQIIDDKGDKWVYFWSTWEGKLKDLDRHFKIPVHLACKMLDNKIVEEYGFYNRYEIDATYREMAMAKDAMVATE
ncbi:hypothetical protein [Mariniflexile sp.]|uniref:hypothetical protein n=1 Tax=Mariniflexile sp. TaxID=1979402 RepID=UPI0040474F16